jgi:hypothetical protein
MMEASGSHGSGSIMLIGEVVAMVADTTVKSIANDVAAKDAAVK